MVDRTALFRDLCGPAAAKEARVINNTTKSAFHVATSALALEISSLTDQVRLFRSDHVRRAMTSSTSRSGAAISSGAERLKRKFNELERAVKMTAETLDSTSSYSNQSKEHSKKVIKTMEERLALLAKEFQETLEKQAKALSTRQERQKSVFGEGVNYRYEVPTRPRPEQHQPQPMTSPFANGNHFSQPIPNQPTNIRQRQPLLYQPVEVLEPQQQQQMLIRKRDKLDITKSRTQDVERVEKTIGEISQMFIQVAEMVQGHGQIIDDIENAVDDAQANTGQAQVELLKLFRFISSERSLIIKILITVLILGMVIIYLWT